MKAFINKYQDVVAESIEGLLANEKLTKLDRFPEIRVVLRKDWDKSRVAIISGGGSGHEPAHAGFVGEGMLTAAVCGDVFASPSVDAVLSAILAVTGEAGCLLIIKNYTGDRLNFGLAAEQARAMGYKVETVTVGDDIALGTDVQCRGIAGTLFVHKIAGCLAAEGKSLEEVASAARMVASNTVSIGLALTECQLFNGSKPSRLGEHQAELGLGIHGESGAEIIDYTTADKLMSIAVNSIQTKLPDSNDSYALLMNNLGTVTPIEMSILVQSFAKKPFAKKVKYIIGPSSFMTALNMAGFSLSFLKLTDEVERTLLTDVEPVAWHKIRKFVSPSSVATPSLPEVMRFAASSSPEVKAIVEKITRTFISIEDDINALDTKVGDGDAGATFAAASKTILAVVDKLPLANTGQLLQTIGRILSRESGGSSGVLLSILFTAAGSSYSETNHLGKALLDGLDKMKAYGGARRGYRTMIDALEPAFEILANDGSIADAAKEARLGADNTRNIVKTNFGRSAYIPKEILSGTSDPGAEAMARIFEALV